MADESASRSEGTSGRFPTRWILYVLVPALIAGFFSFLPKFYEDFTRPKSELDYKVVSGPAIGAPNGFQQIFSIALTNNGKTPLTDVKLEIHSANGRIETLVVDQASPLLPRVAKTPTA